jgi:hypothetical protein
VGLFVTKACLIGKNIKFIADRKVDVNIVTTDNDYFDIKGRKDEIIDFTYV